MAKIIENFRYNDIILYCKGWYYKDGNTFITYNRKSNNTMLFSITITIIWWGVVILVEK